MASHSNFEFQCGMTFNSWAECQVKVNVYQEKNCELLTTLRGEKLYPPDFKNSHRTAKEIEELIEKLQYKFNILKCKLGPSTSKPKKNKTRSTSTFNHHCPFYVKFETVQVEPNDYKLQITETNIQHKNHPSHYKKLYKALPELRRLPPKLKLQVEKYIRLGCSNKKIRCEIEKTYKIFIKSKDISNLRQSLRPKNSNDLKTFDRLLREKYGCTTRIKIDNNNKFEALLFTNSTMKKSMNDWPEMLFIDGTYKLFNLGFTLYLIMVQNGSGRGEIVTASIVTKETAENIEWIAKNFRELNDEACRNTICVMTDKDLTERRAFAKVFPDAQFLLCLFHTLKTFDRKLKGLKITKEEKCVSFKWLRNLAYARSPKYYACTYKKFSSQVPKCVKIYFDYNWHTNRDEWTKFGMAKYNYGNDTNNIIESTNKQIKTICHYHSTLCEFADNFFQLLKASKLEGNLQMATEGLKKLNIETKLDYSLNKYADFLTKVAFNKLNEELHKYSSITVIKSFDEAQVCSMIIDGYRYTSSTTDCKCHFRTSLKLPCIHILTARKHYNLNLFDAELCDNKWSKAINLQVVSSDFDGNYLADSFFIESYQETEAIEAHDRLSLDNATGDTAEASFGNIPGNERQQILQPLFDRILKNAKRATETEFKKIHQDLEKFTEELHRSHSVANHFDNNVELSTVTLPPARKLRGRPRADMKTTTGFFPRKK